MPRLTTGSGILVNRLLGSNPNPCSYVPVFQLAEKGALKALQCGFESHQEHAVFIIFERRQICAERRIATIRCGYRRTNNLMENELQRRIATLLVGLVALLSGFAVAATPANAAWSSCRSGANCFWDLHSGSGTPYESFPSSNLACHTLPTAQRNKASSLKNNKSGSRIWYFNKTSCQEAPAVALNYGEQVSLFVPHPANNNIESYRVCYFAEDNCYDYG